jgi:hypothetical protein
MLFNFYLLSLFQSLLHHCSKNFMKAKQVNREVFFSGGTKCINFRYQNEDDSNILNATK